MIPLIEEEMVHRKQWVTAEELVDLMAVAQGMPGVFAVNIAIAIGYKLRRLRGALVMALGTVLPSFLMILAIALFFRQFKDIPTVEHVFRGIRPAVVALIAVPVLRVARTAHIGWRTVWIPVAATLLIVVAKVSPIDVIILGGIGGYLWGRYKA